MTLFDFDFALRHKHDAYVASAKSRVQTGKVVHLAFAGTNRGYHFKSGRALTCASNDRMSDNDITIVYLTGTAAQDIASTPTIIGAAPSAKTL